MTHLDQILTEIAQQHLGLDTLETRRADHLDFHEVAVWALRNALLAAYAAGMALGPSPLVDAGLAQGADSASKGTAA